jgi:hypothetical protein
MQSGQQASVAPIGVEQPRRSWLPRPPRTILPLLATDVYRGRRGQDGVAWTCALACECFCDLGPSDRTSPYGRHLDHADPRGPALTARLLSRRPVFGASPPSSLAHSAVGPQAGGRLHRPDDAQVGPREVDVGRRAIPSVGHLTTGSPRTQQSRRDRWDDWIARTMHKPDRAKLPAVVALLL